MTSYPLDTLAATVDANGIHTPTFADILASLKASFQSIYGSDTYLEEDSQDGQFLAVLASAINASNDTAVAVYNSFSPSTAQGAGLASVVKINGLAKLVPSNSSADILITGDVGRVINGGQVGDAFGNVWNLPAVVNIGPAGSVVATATAATAGALAAPANTITRILTPTRGWQTATNPLAATPGAPVESDSALRQRQSVSTARPALSVFDSMVAEIANLPGVQRYRGYENDGGTPDANGIPARTTSFVVDGGDALAIGQAIANKKTPGSPTYGTTAETVYDSQGVPNTIYFYRPTPVRIIATINIQALPGYISSTGAAAAAALAAFVSASNIGDDVYNNKAVAVASLIPADVASTFNITSVQTAKFGNALGTADIVIAFNEAASLALSDITVVAS